MPSFDILTEKANNLPLLPGVYIMLDASGKVIYVGKAKKLKNRVSSYFHGEHLPKVSAMISKIDDFNVIIVKSEFEALVLENSLIKQYKPRYNILLKDDKGYPFIRVDLKSDYPTLGISNRMLKDGANYFGPFGSRGKTREILSALRQAYMLPDCGKSFPVSTPNFRPCLNSHIGNCAGWCTGNPDKTEYNDRIQSIVQILQGKNGEIVKTLKAEMNTASEELCFERAALLRDRIRVLESLGSKQRVFSTNINSTDVFGFSRGSVCCLSVLKYNDGNLTEKDIEFTAEPVDDDETVLAGLIRQYYSRPGIVIPKTILVQCAIEFEDELKTALSEESGHSVAIEFPQRGDRRKLVDYAVTNASEEIVRITTEEQRRHSALVLLSNALDLDSVPERIEAFDISNFGDSGIVAGMSVFINGKRDRSEYRRFNLKEIKNQDDYASMREVLLRRYTSMLKGEKGLDKKPDLILIDGGAVHTETAADVLNDLSLNIPVFGMVKDNRHRTRALINASGEEISIDSNVSLFSLVGNIQEETHNYAIEYQRKLRNSSFNSALDGIAGIGEKRKAELLKRFKSVSGIKAASLDELKLVLPENAAKSVYYYFNPEGVE